MREDFENTLHNLINSVRKSGDQLSKKYQINGVDGVTVVFDADGKEECVELTITIAVERASRYTENYLGYPSTLEKINSNELDIVGNSAMDAVREVTDTDAKVPLVYSSDNSTPGEVACYQAIFDIWFTEEGEIDDIWIRAQPQKDE